MNASRPFRTIIDALGRAAIALAVLMIVYAVSAFIVPLEGFWGADNGMKFIQMRALIESNYQSLAIDWPGRSIDPQYEFSPFPRPWAILVEDRLYGTFSWPFALLSSIAYRTFGASGLVLLPFLGGLVTIIGAWLLTGELATAESRRVAQPLASVLTALCTPVWFYSLAFWEHSIAVALGSLAALSYLRYDIRHRRRSVIIAAVLLALACYFRDELYLAALIIMLGLILRSRHHRSDVLYFAGTFCCCLIPLWTINWASIGHPLGVHLQATTAFDNGLVSYLQSRLTAARFLLLGAHANMWVSAIVIVPYLLLWIASGLTPGRYHLSVDRSAWIGPLLAAHACIAGTVILLGYLRAESLLWLLNANSLFAASPILIFSLVGSSGSRSELQDRDAAARPAGRVLLCGLLLYVVAYVLTTPVNVSGGVHWGCRLLLIAYPILCALAAVTLARVWNTRKSRVTLSTVLIVLAIGLSLSMQIHSLSLLKERRKFSTALSAYVASQEEHAVIAIGPFIPQQLGAVFHDKAIFRVNSSDDLKHLEASLNRAGISEAMIVYGGRLNVGSTPSHEISDGSLNLDTVTIFTRQLGDPDAP